jgi:hypothetical protein
MKGEIVAIKIYKSGGVLDFFWKDAPIKEIRYLSRL